MTDDVIAMATFIYETSKVARDRGALSIWTIFDRPADFPDTVVARRHQVAKGEDGPTTDFVTGDIGEIREAMMRCGLYCMTRDPTDDPKIVESWL